MTQSFIAPFRLATTRSFRIIRDGPSRRAFNDLVLVSDGPSIPGAHLMPIRADLNGEHYSKRDKKKKAKRDLY
jgi:hypothetical protein